MRDLLLAEGLYLQPTPAGAYHAVSNPTPCIAGKLLLALMRQESPRPLDRQGLMQLTSLPEQASLDLLYQLQRLQLIRGAAVSGLPDAETSLENTLPSLLGQLAGNGRSLLADDQGFYLHSHGFHHEAAEELAALCAELNNLRRRYNGLLSGNLKRTSHAWALTGAGGYSDIGFWPLHCGAHSFVLVLDSLPNLNQPATVELIWRLIRRYGTPTNQQ